ncbi:phytanoyl-CoA dioxygenase family protein [uncultured Phenylobacterium sp.]|uniref:phytanoyl-CoA dioxygenase family protein n=1 Tax=uncultured Phenylobacterium sp. TaxID=349273 RepID=UPI0025F7DF21|nr:phytanoyl-CoA dioxygenase family protein [uncultured Phenylobacterium sp.]
MRDLLPGVPLIDSPFFDEILETSNWDAETRRVATELHRDGFATLDFQEPDLDALAADIDRTLFSSLPWEDWRAGRLDGLERVGEAWSYNDSVRRIAANAHVVDLLGRVYGRRAFPFQTLNFAIGSQQAAHVDLVHFASMPENFMCGVWLALEDVADGAGPLIYYPGSHRWRLFLNEHIGRIAPPADRIGDDLGKFDAIWAKQREASGVAPVRFHPRKGQALIWHAGLHHGGAPHTDRSRSRKSQVTHYMFDDCAYWTPMLSAPFAGRIAFRRQTPDVRTSEIVANRANGGPRS